MPLEEAVQQLIARANAAGGRDNISVVLVEFDSVTPTNERAISGVRKVAPKVASPTLHAFGTYGNATVSLHLAYGGVHWCVRTRDCRILRGAPVVREIGLLLG